MVPDCPRLLSSATFAGGRAFRGAAAGAVASGTLEVVAGEAARRLDAAVLEMELVPGAGAAGETCVVTTAGFALVARFDSDSGVIVTGRVLLALAVPLGMVVVPEATARVVVLRTVSLFSPDVVGAKPGTTLSPTGDLIVMEERLEPIPGAGFTTDFWGRNPKAAAGAATNLSEPPIFAVS
jgi:hypothetical protein